MENIKRNIAWNTLGSLTYLICLWLTTIFVVILSPNYENSGILAFCMATANIYSTFATYNMRTYQVSDTDNKYSSQNYVGFRYLTTGISYLTTLLMMIVFVQNHQMIIAVLVFLLYKVDEAIVNVFYGIDQKASRIDIVGKSQLIRGFVVLLLFVAVLYFSQNIITTFFSMFVGCFLITAVYDIPHAMRLASIRPFITRKIFFDLLKECLPVVLSLFCYTSVAAFTRQWFGLQYGDEALGIYAAIATPCALVQSLCSYLYQPFLTTFSNYWSLKEYSHIKMLFLKITGIFGLSLLLCIFIAQVFGEYVLRFIYGENIVQYTWLLVPALIAAALMASSYFVTDILTCFRKLKLVLIINALAMIVALFSMGSLMELLFMNGVNMTIIVSFAASTLIGGFCMYKLLKE